MGCYFNPFLANVLILYQVKTTSTLGWNWRRIISSSNTSCLYQIIPQLKTLFKKNSTFRNSFSFWLLPFLSSFAHDFFDFLLLFSSFVLLLFFLLLFSFLFLFSLLQLILAKFKVTSIKHPFLKLSILLLFVSILRTLVTLLQGMFAWAISI